MSENEDMIQPSKRRARLLIKLIPCEFDERDTDEKKEGVNGVIGGVVKYISPAPSVQRKRLVEK